MTNPTPQPDSPEDTLARLKSISIRNSGLVTSDIEWATTQIEEYYTNKFLEIVDKTEAGQYGEEADFALSDIRQAIKQLSKPERTEV